MRLSFYTVGILACMVSLIAAWSKEGKFSPRRSILVPDPSKRGIF
jgi:hypothetical protein